VPKLPSFLVYRNCKRTGFGHTGKLYGAARLQETAILRCEHGVGPADDAAGFERRELAQ
jgi:hypothetical protein